MGALNQVSENTLDFEDGDCGHWRCNNTQIVSSDEDVGDADYHDHLLAPSYDPLSPADNATLEKTLSFRVTNVR